MIRGEIFITREVRLERELSLKFLEWIKNDMPGVLTNVSTRDAKTYLILCLFRDEREYLLFTLGKEGYGVK
jgi:hypothetical protein